MISVEEEQLRRLRTIVEAAGYTIQQISPRGWCALLPGETEFRDNSAAVDANPTVAHSQNYLGFFSSESDLLDEVAPLANERLRRDVHLYAVTRIKVCGVEGDDKQAISAAARFTDVNRLLRRHILSDAAQKTARCEVAHIEFADEFSRILVDLVDLNGERVEGSEAYFEGDVEGSAILPGGLTTEERATHLLTRIVLAHVAGQGLAPLISEAADVLDGRLLPGTAAEARSTSAAPRPRG